MTCLCVPLTRKSSSLCSKWRSSWTPPLALRLPNSPPSAGLRWLMLLSTRCEKHAKDQQLEYTAHGAGRAMTLIASRTHRYNAVLVYGVVPGGLLLYQRPRSGFGPFLSTRYISDIDQVSTPQVFYTYFYSHARRLRLEKILYVESFLEISSDI